MALYLQDVKVGKLDSEQKKVLREIVAGSYRSGLKGRARRLALRTAIGVGSTESGYRNLPGGDRDSQGWRQERAMYYKNPRNLRASVDRFYAEYKADANPKSSLGERAQAVQQSGTPNVWNDQKPVVNYLERMFDRGGKFATSKRGGGRGGATRAPKYLKGKETFDSRAFVLSQIGQSNRKPGDLTSGFLRELADPNSPFRSITEGRAIPGKVNKGKKAGKNQMQKFTDGIAKDGWFGSKSAGLPYVKRLGIGASSEKRPTVLTASGGVSDHYEGNKDSYAWDLPTSGAAGTKKARQLAKMLGENWEGGSWLNVTKKIGGRTYRFQIGWNVPDHYDHIHFGVDRVDKPG